MCTVLDHIGRRSREIAVTREILFSKFRALSCGTASTSGSRERWWTTVMDPSSVHAIIIMGAQRNDITWFGPPYPVAERRRYRRQLWQLRRRWRRRRQRRGVSITVWPVGNAIVYRCPTVRVMLPLFDAWLDNLRGYFVPRLPAGPVVVDGGFALNVRDFTSSFSNPTSVLRPSHVRNFAILLNRGISANVVISVRLRSRINQFESNFENKLW